MAFVDDYASALFESVRVRGAVSKAHQNKTLVSFQAEIHPALEIHAKIGAHLQIGKDVALTYHLVTIRSALVREYIPGSRQLRFRASGLSIGNELFTYTGSCSCIQLGASSLGSLVRSMIRRSSTMRLLTGLERRAKSALATRRMARVNSRRLL